MPPREPPDDDRDTFKFVVLATGRSQKGCGMAFIKKPFRRLAEGAASEADTYIDLAELSFENEGGTLGEPAGGGISHDVAFLADGVFELRFSGAGEGKVQLLFRCAKMRHTNHWRDYFVLTYDKGFAARPYEAPKSSRWGR